MVFHVFAVKFALDIGVSSGRVYIMPTITSSFGRGYPKHVVRTIPEGDMRTMRGILTALLICMISPTILPLVVGDAARKLG